MKHADVIIPRGLDNHCAVELITKHVFHQLNEYGLFVFRDSLVLMNERDGKGEPSNLIMVEQSAQNKGIFILIISYHLKTLCFRNTYHNKRQGLQY